MSKGGFRIIAVSRTRCGYPADIGIGIGIGIGIEYDTFVPKPIPIPIPTPKVTLRRARPRLRMFVRSVISTRSPLYWRSDFRVSKFNGTHHEPYRDAQHNQGGPTGQIPRPRVAFMPLCRRNARTCPPQPRDGGTVFPTDLDSPARMPVPPWWETASACPELEAVREPRRTVESAPFRIVLGNYYWEHEMLVTKPKSRRGILPLHEAAGSRFYLARHALQSISCSRQ